MQSITGNATADGYEDAGLAASGGSLLKCNGRA
jgi:hypothetical protein